MRPKWHQCCDVPVVCSWECAFRNVDRLLFGYPIATRMLIRWLTFCWVELPLSVALVMADHLRDSRVVHRGVDLLVSCLTGIATRVLREESVQNALAQTIAQGIQTFLQHDNLEVDIRNLASCVSKTQPDLARQHGQDFPVLVGSFIQGMLHNATPKPNHNNTQQQNDPLDSKTTQQSSTPGTNTTECGPVLLQHAESPVVPTSDAQVPLLLRDNQSSKTPVLEENIESSVSNSTLLTEAKQKEPPPPLIPRLSFPRFGVGSGGGSHSKNNNTVLKPLETLNTLQSSLSSNNITTTTIIVDPNAGSSSYGGTRTTTDASFANNIVVDLDSADYHATDNCRIDKKEV